MGKTQEMTMMVGETVSETVLDAEPVARLREMGRSLGAEVPRRIIELYLGDSPARVATLRQALADRDDEALESAAHALKGSSANLGASALARHCQQLERMSRGTVLGDARAKLEDLEAEYDRVERAMRRLLDEL